MDQEFFDSNLEISVSDESVLSTIVKITKDKNKEGDTEAFYVCNLNRVVQNFVRGKIELPRIRPYYAVKCNDDKTLLSVLAKLESGFDCSSKADIQKALDAGANKDHIIYANPCKETSHVQYASKMGVKLMTFDNEDELHKIKALYPEAHLLVRILPPNNTSCQCQLGSKYGCHPRKVKKLLRVAKKLKLNIIGVSFHVGSGCHDAFAYTAAVSSAKDVFDQAAAEGFKFTLLDVGGGFQDNQDSNGDLFATATAALRKAVDTYFPTDLGVRIIAEPGRYFVEVAFTLTVNIIARRDITNSDIYPELEGTPDEDVEQGFMYYLNDGIYGSFNCLVFDHATVVPSLLEPEKYVGAQLYPSSLWGPTPDGLDCISKAIVLPKLEVGDWLVFSNMGAYTRAGASDFCGMSKPKCYYLINETTINQCKNYLTEMKNLSIANHS